tara:strand:- start:5054 stop:5686 length:633 start_codon:yes stop_codon:yes gene_type:complete
MSGTFPNPELFKSMRITSNINRLNSIDVSNKQYDKFISQRWQIEMQSIPLTRSQWNTIYSFILKQKGSIGTFNITPPLISSTRGTYPNDSNFKTYNGYLAGTSELQVDTTTVGDATFGIVGTLSVGDFIKFSNHDKVYQLTNNLTLQNFFGSPEQVPMRIFPALTTAVYNDTQIIFNSVPFKTRLIADNQDFNANANNTYTYTLNVTEEY